MFKNTLIIATVLAAFVFMATPVMAEEAFLCDNNIADSYSTAEACELNCDPPGQCTTVNLTPQGSVETPTVDGSVGANEVTPAFETRELDNPLGGRDMSIQTVVARVIQLFTGLAGSLALLMFVYGSFLLMTSRGDDQKVAKGKQTMIWAIGGLIVMFTAYAVLQLVFKGLGA